MNGFAKAMFFAGLVGMLGCARTRLPSLEPSSPQAEHAQFERFYPYPEGDSGPSVRDAQPPGYDVQRSESRRIQRDTVVTPYGY